MSTSVRCRPYVGGSENADIPLFGGLRSVDHCLSQGLPVNAGAQSAQGGLRGTVKDAQSPIPGVTVTMVNQATGVTRETITNGVGEYSFPAVDPGSYTVRVAVQGFKTFEQKDVIINTQSFMGLDVTLEIGTLEESITVTGQSPLIETTNASTGGVDRFAGA